MENKYFTPDIQDIRVGYECELNGVYKKMSEDEVIKYIGMSQGLTIINPDGQPQEFYNIRVPHLTKEQIEAEGWKYEESKYPLKGGIYFFTKGNYMMLFNDRLYTISILARDVTLIEWLPDFPELFRVVLSCKDINTFRYICKLLNIK